MWQDRNDVVLPADQRSKIAAKEITIMPLDEAKLIETYGLETNTRAKQLSDRCPQGYFIVDDHENKMVYYRNTNPPYDDKPTDFTAEHVRIANYGFEAHHPSHIEWNHMSSAATHHKCDYYLAKQR
jgi:hypothetical protein